MHANPIRQLMLRYVQIRRGNLLAFPDQDVSGGAVKPIHRFFIVARVMGAILFSEPSPFDSVNASTTEACD